MAEDAPVDTPEVTRLDDDRIDEFAAGIFDSLGYTGKLPDTMVNFYNALKRQKDAIKPGRLSPEGFATVIILSDLTDGRFNPKDDGKDDGEE